MSRSSQAGLTLVEVLLAAAILVSTLLIFLGMRTEALIDANEARSWRIARELAESALSELRAGAHEDERESGQEITFEDYPDFRAVIVIGEAEIGQYESQAAEDLAYSSDSAGDAADRLSWQQERDAIRNARQQGLSYNDYQDQLTQERLDEEEETAPSEDELEDVAVFVYFPKTDPDDDSGGDEDQYVLKAKVSTLAIKGWTPDRAQDYAERNNLTPGGATTSAGSGGSPFGGDE